MNPVMSPLSRIAAALVLVGCVAWLPAAAQNPPPSPAVTPTPVQVLILPPDAPPQILAMTISSNVVDAGGTLTGSLVASSNVASVEVRVATYGYNMVKVAPGEFTLSVTVPNVPKMFRGTYDLIAIARNTRGDAVQQKTSLTIR